MDLLDEKQTVNDILPPLRNLVLDNHDGSEELEKMIHEFKTELCIKRGQVKQLKADLEIVTSELQEIKRTLNESTHSLAEKNFNFNLITKKLRTVEEELIGKTNAYNTIQMQHKVVVAELEKMKENFQKSESEKSDLLRKLEVLETKIKQNSIYYNQISKREGNLKRIIEDVKETMQKLKTNQCVVLELSKTANVADKALENYKQLSKNYELLKNSKDHFEELYIKTNAKYEMLAEILRSDEDISEDNVMNQIIFNQWKSNRQYHAEQVGRNNEIITKLSDGYTSEKQLNVELIHKNDELASINQALNNEIKNLKIDMEKLNEKCTKQEGSLKNKIHPSQPKLKTKKKRVKTKPKSQVKSIEPEIIEIKEDINTNANE